MPCRPGTELHKIYVSILSHLLAQMKQTYESKEAEDQHIRMLSWRAFKAAGTACNILFDQRFFDRRFIGDDDAAIDESNQVVDTAATEEKEEQAVENGRVGGKDNDAA